MPDENDDLAEKITNELPAGWKLLRIRNDGTIEVESETRNLVVQGKDWAWIKQQLVSLMLSHRGGV
jgi:hypothetical protein